MVNIKNVRNLTLLAFLFLICSVGPACAATANISYPYYSIGNISTGDMVSNDSSKSNYVDPANTNNSSRLLGVAVKSSNSLIAVGQNDKQIQVAVSGTVNVLASTIDGNINIGDQVSTSPFNGIGMKSIPGMRILGVAKSNLNDKTPNTEPETVKNTSGQSEKVKVGYVEVSIAIGNSNPSGSVKTSTLQRLARSLTGKTISNTRIILSLMITIIAVSAMLALVYTSISSTVIAIGRNPLAKRAVYRTLAFVLMMVFLTGGVAIIAVYYLLS